MIYRLGPLGLLHIEESERGIRGNFGLWDQNFAMRWTKESIANLGGDSDKITIFDQSAGGRSIRAHVVSPPS